MQTTRKPKLEEARRRWGKARLLNGTRKPQSPKPAAPAIALARRAA